MEKALYFQDKQINLYNKKIDVREKIINSGINIVSDEELLMAILGSGSHSKSVKHIATEIIEKCNLSNNVPKIEDLCKISGLGVAQACRIISALELGKRYYGLREQRISNPEDIWNVIKHYANKKQEYFLSITLNGAHCMIGTYVITMGLINRSIIHAREVFAEAIKERACAIVVAHNHPSGLLEPSEEDLQVTHRLNLASEILGIPLLDHIIFSDKSYSSLMERGIIKHK